MVSDPNNEVPPISTENMTQEGAELVQKIEDTGQGFVQSLDQPLSDYLTQVVRLVEKEGWEISDERVDHVISESLQMCEKFRNSLSRICDDLENRVAKTLHSFASSPSSNGQ